MATGFAHRYREDSLLRTEINIIALQLGYAALVVGLSVVGLFVLYREVIHGITAAIATALTSSTPVSSEAIMQQLEATRTREVLGTVAAIFATAAIFGYLVTRFALAPARNALTAQKRFIGNIAHELRTPLAVIRTNTEVRLLDTDVSRVARDLHASNLEELDRISNLINNLLTLNTLLRPEQMSFGEVDIGAVVQHVTDSLANLIEKRRLRIRIDVAGNYPAWGNAAALEQILMNLVKNAVQHTFDGEVRISTALDEHRNVVVTVLDTGTGIPPDDLARIFEPFYRGDRARTRSGGTGSGLGLAIVNELVKLHGGHIRIRSEVDLGTKVILTLPSRYRGRITHQ